MTEEGTFFFLPPEQRSKKSENIYCRFKKKSCEHADIENVKSEIYTERRRGCCTFSMTATSSWHTTAVQLRRQRIPPAQSDRSDTALRYTHRH